RGRPQQRLGGFAVVAADLAALHDDLRARGACEPIAAVFTVHRDRHERLTVDEVVDARTLFRVRLDVEVATVRLDVRAARVHDARAVAAQRLRADRAGRCER